MSDEATSLAALKSLIIELGVSAHEWQMMAVSREVALQQAQSEIRALKARLAEFDTGNRED